jgi:hypothetical protein
MPRTRRALRTTTRRSIGSINVRELIEALEWEDPEALVVFSSDFGDIGHTEQVHSIGGDIEEVKLTDPRTVAVDGLCDVRMTRTTRPRRRRRNRSDSANQVTHSHFNEEITWQRRRRGNRVDDKPERLPACGRSRPT